MNTGALTPDELRALLPYLEGESPKPNGEWDMHCPLHQDARRSASLNVEKAEFYCNACGQGGSVQMLMMQQDEWIPLDPDAAHSNNGHRAAPTERLSINRADSWNDILLEHADEALYDLMEKRGLTRETVEERLIGWDERPDPPAYTIPIFDEDGNLLNVRRYRINPPPGKPKIWSVSGHGTDVLYPVDQLEEETLIICEGELDALISIQNGYPAITRTGAAKVWKPEWSPLFAGKRVYLCHDADHAGVAANRKVAKSLIRYTQDIWLITLPYEITAKHGKDLTDFWLEHDAGLFGQLLERAAPVRAKVADVPIEVSVTDAGAARHTGRRVRMRVQTKGRITPEYTVPAKIKFTCGMNYGPVRCSVCPMKEMGGEMEDEIEPNEDIILSMLKSNRKELREALRERNEIYKGCPRFEINVEKYQSVEKLVVIPSIDHTKHQITGGDYKTRDVVSVGKHDTPAGISVDITGAMYPDPRTQASTFQAWDVVPVETSLDSYGLDAEKIQICKLFHPGPGETPLHKMKAIADELAKAVTKIYGRPHMHVMADLVFHSALRFEFAGVMDDRGWVEALIVGDTRTGKSFVAKRLIEHYGVGELIGCETATVAGILGGVEKSGNDRWNVNWGAIPLNDRRLVVLDEASGLGADKISQLSAMRSSGVAQMAKIIGERANARTRLLWIANPESGKNLANYAYGVDAIQPIIGNDEDISRFDIAMTVRDGEVNTDEFINKIHPGFETRYTSEACNALIHWAWSRKPEQIIWTKKATETCMISARAVGKMYNQDPPLVQAASVRIKIARLATAIAMRLFSCDKDLNCIVMSKHVKAAEAFMNSVYRMKGFGYLARSERKIKDKRAAVSHQDNAVDLLANRPKVTKYLHDCGGKFKTYDLYPACAGDTTAAAALVQQLADMDLITGHGGLWFIQEALWDVLRKVDK